jgi:hypothetical protein
LPATLTRGHQIKRNYRELILTASTCPASSAGDSVVKRYINGSRKLSA